MKKIILFFYIFYAVLFLYHCKSDNNTNIEKEKTLRIGILTFPNTLNPLYVTDEASTMLINKVYDSLYYFDINGNVKSRIIKNEKIIVNTNTFEIILIIRNDIFFSNGMQLTTKDIVNTINLIKDIKYLSPYRPYVGLIKKIILKGNYKLRIVFNKKNANWKNYLTFKILNSKEINNISPKMLKKKTLSGTGPLKFNYINRPSEIVLSPNIFYSFAKKPLYSKIIYSVIAYAYNSPLKLLNDEIDIVGLQKEDVLVYKHNKRWKKKFRVFSYKKFGYTYLSFNLNKPELSLNIRKLFYNLMYNSSFLKKFLNNRGEIIYTPFLLLNEKTKNVSFKTKPINKTLSFTILSNTKSQIQREFLLFLADELKSFNISLKPVFLESQLLYSKLKNKDYEIAISGYVLDIDYDMKDILYSNSFFNYSNYQNSAMDKQLELGLNTFNSINRRKIYLKANDIWLKDLPMIPLFNLYYYSGVSRKIKTPRQTVLVMGSAGDFLQNIEEWIY